MPRSGTPESIERQPAVDPEGHRRGRGSDVGQNGSRLASVADLLEYAKMTVL
jgi:hypothetical protein